MKIKILSEDIKHGMYISALDKPWVDSPFLFQGFSLKDDEEFQQIKSTCKYVYVDTKKTPFEVKAHRDTITAASQNKKQPSVKLRHIDTITLKNTTAEKITFTQNLVEARKSRDKTRSYIDSMLAEARMGSIIDTHKAKELVAELANNIASGTDASMWLTQLKNRDEYTAIHSLNVCVLSLTFGRALNLSEPELNELGLGALLHDIGKMQTPLEVLNKPGKLTQDEFEIMKSHPVKGYELLKNDNNISFEVKNIVKSHHERLGGSGYPDNLIEKDISYFTKIVSITDVYDAITSDRVYHDGMTPHDAMQRLYEWMPNNYDQQLMQKFIRTLGIYPIGSVVELKSGHVGLVVKLNDEHRMKPVVMLIMDRDKKYYPKRKLVNLASELWEKNGSRPEIKRILDPKEFNLDIKTIINEESLK